MWLPRGGIKGGDEIIALQFRESDYQKNRKESPNGKMPQRNEKSELRNPKSDFQKRNQPLKIAKLGFQNPNSELTFRVLGSKTQLRRSEKPVLPS
jgi:hypothetical protein